MDLRISDLELFVTAARLSNLGQAAALHHLSQSAASTAIQRVETSLGLTLCTHERRQFRLTAKGKELLPKAEAWLRDLKENLISTEAKPLTLATTHAIARVAIPVILPIETIELKLMRPDIAYGSVLRDEADLALVLDNAPWTGVIKTEIGKGKFQLFSTQKNAPQQPVLLPEDRIEVHTLQQRWKQQYLSPLSIKARLPSWSLIADICSNSTEVGFLPDFLARSSNLHPVPWQPPASLYRILALHRKSTDLFQKRVQHLLRKLRSIF